MKKLETNVIPLKFRQNLVCNDLVALIRSINKYAPRNFNQVSYKSIPVAGGYDRLEIKTDEDLNWDWIKINCTERRARECGNYYKSRNYLINKTRYMFTVRTCPRNTSGYKAKVEFNPNQFTKYRKYKKMLRKILGTEASRNHVLTRLDMSILIFDEFVSYDFLKLAMWMPGIQAFSVKNFNETKGRDGREMIYGADPHAVAIYEREREGLFGYKMINIEIRIWDEKIEEELGIASAFDLEKIHARSFVDNLKFKNIFYFNLDRLSQSQLKSVFDLVDNVKEKGLQLGIKNTRAYKMNQFDRYYKNIFCNLKIGEEKLYFTSFLEYVIRRNMEAFFLKPKTIKKQPKVKQVSTLHKFMKPFFKTSIRQAQQKTGYNI